MTILKNNKKTPLCGNFLFLLTLANFKSQGKIVNSILTVYDTWNSGSSNDADVEREVVCYISFI